MLVDIIFADKIENTKKIADIKCSMASYAGPYNSRN